MNFTEPEFQKYLIGKGYSVLSPGGRKSTVYSYCNRINKVCKIEGITWEALAAQIDEIVHDYDTGGKMAKEGENSKRTTINALKAYRDYLNGL